MRGREKDRLNERRRTRTEKAGEKRKKKNDIETGGLHKTTLTAC